MKSLSWLSSLLMLLAVGTYVVAQEAEKADDKEEQKTEEKADDKPEEKADEEPEEKPEEKPDDKPEEKVEVVLDKLHNPTGLAVQPGTGHLFVADSGAGKVIRVVDGKAQDVITDFPSDVYGKGPKYNIGPLGLAFIDENTLVVGGGGLPDTEEIIRVYTVPKAGEEAIKADNMKAELGPLPSSEEEKLAAEGNYYGVVVTKDAIYATANGDDTKGWVVRAQIKEDGTFGDLERYIASKEETKVDAPVAITTDAKGNLVVGQMGEITVEHDGLLTFYNAKSKKMLLNLETGLHDVTALAYGEEKEGGLRHLYATDFAWLKPEDGGLYRLDAEGKGQEQEVTPVKIVALKKPAAMVFGDGGALYIAIFGDTKGDGDDNGGADPKTGQVIMLAPGL